MSFFDALNISASGLTAERMRMDVTSENLANAQTTQSPGGQPYQRQEVVLQSVGGDFGNSLAQAMGNRAASRRRPGGGDRRRQDARPARLQPGRPGREQGRLRPDAERQPVTEMTDLIDESDTYQSDVTAMSTSKTMYSDTLQLLK